MDITTNFPIECLEDVFRHLSGNDLLKCSVVSPDWSDFIGSTKSCMEKIILTSVNCEHIPGNIEIILKNSQRRYECLKLKEPFYKNIHELLLAKGRKWTHIDFKRILNFSSINEFLDFLKIFQSSVQKLVLHNDHIEGDSGSFQDDALKFP